MKNSYVPIIESKKIYKLNVIISDRNDHHLKNKNYDKLFKQNFEAKEIIKNEF